MCDQNLDDAGNLDRQQRAAQAEQTSRDEQNDDDSDRVQLDPFADDSRMQKAVFDDLRDSIEPDHGRDRADGAYMPGSHRQQYFDAYDTNETVPGEVQLLVRVAR
ncbi:MAG TPA: hypothetical protein VHM01_06820 [Alphaproteobacteria bacterium]|nr:hypothetical protein [Alphaproteobacteria bacterium]